MASYSVGKETKRTIKTETGMGKARGTKKTEREGRKIAKGI